MRHQYHSICSLKVCLSCRLLPPCNDHKIGAYISLWRPIITLGARNVAVVFGKLQCSPEMRFAI